MSKRPTEHEHVESKTPNTVRSKDKKVSGM